MDESLLLNKPFTVALECWECRGWLADFLRWNYWDCWPVMLMFFLFIFHKMELQYYTEYVLWLPCQPAWLFCYSTPQQYYHDLCLLNLHFIWLQKSFLNLSIDRPKSTLLSSSKREGMGLLINSIITSAIMNQKIRLNDHDCILGVNWAWYSR